MDVSDHEIDELIRRYSKTYRKACLDFILSNIRIGDSFEFSHMTVALEKNGFDVRDIPWWSQARILKESSRFKKVGKGKWQRVR